VFYIIPVIGHSKSGPPSKNTNSATLLDFVTPSTIPSPAARGDYASGPGISPLGCGLIPQQLLLWELLLVFASHQDRAEGILLYLARAESKEPNAWLADDYRVAWLTVLHASRGLSNPWEFAFWSYYGKTIDKALIAWAERDAQTARELARCAAMVKKPPQSEKSARRRDAA
jgi:hypothetical protein